MRRSSPSPLFLLALAASVCPSLERVAAAGALPGPIPAEWAQAFRRIREDRPPPQLVRHTHYVVSNENRHYLYRDAVRNQGGVYIGVGTDQNYLISGWSRPEIMVLMDFDQVVVDVHRIYRLLFLTAKTPEAFYQLWQPKHQNRVRALIDREFSDEKTRQRVRLAFRLSHTAIARRLSRVLWKYNKLGIRTFLNDQAQYDYLVSMFRHNRVYMVRGDLTADVSMNDIAHAVRAAGLQVRTLYLSNAERYFGYGQDFRANMLGLPMDAHTQVLRTSDFRQGRYQYSTQTGSSFQAWLRHQGTTSVAVMLKWREGDRVNGLSRIACTPTDVAVLSAVVPRKGDRARPVEALSTTTRMKRPALIQRVEAAPPVEPLLALPRSEEEILSFDPPLSWF